MAFPSLSTRTGPSLLAAALALGPACTCGDPPDMDEGPTHYVRCGQAEVPETSRWSAAGLRFASEGRVLRVSGKPTYKVAVFEGPVGAPLDAEEVALLQQAQPDLALYLGGLGDDEEMAAASLAALGASDLPVLFLPGGADRWPVMEEAFDGLKGDAKKRLRSLAGYHRLDVGDTQFALMPGAPLGRYAIGDDACGFGPEDIEAVNQTFQAVAEVADRRLLAWAAPSGWGLTASFGRLEVGSPDLHILAQALGIESGVFAYPRGQGTGAAPQEREPGPFMAPRLAPEGSVAADGAYAVGGVGLLSLPVEQVEPENPGQGAQGAP